jgi:hypothetical protein
MWYTDVAINLAFRDLPTPLAEYFDGHLDQLLAVVYFAPELVTAILGGVVAVCLIRTQNKPALALPREEPSPNLASNQE